jgi:hypothetical protein
LPGVIGYANTQLGYGVGHGIAHPAGYYVAPQTLTDDYLNSVIVSAKVATQAMSPGTFKNEAQIVVYSINERIEVREQIEDAFDRSGLVRGILYRYLTGCIDPQGRRVWRLLEPTGVSMLPEAWEGYSGVACSYRMVQSPDDNAWI